MVDPKNVDMNRLPKKFCDGAMGAFGKDTVSFAVTSGEELVVFACTPVIMKSISTWFSKMVEEYEKAHGPIDTSMPKIISPIQVSDLGKNK